MRTRIQSGAIVYLAVLALGAWSVSRADDLAKKAQNPVGDVINVPLQFNFNSGVGPDDDLQTLLNIQPVYPARLTDKWNLINRTIIPLIDQPAPVDKFGMGDIQYQGYLTPAEPKGWILGFGPVLSLPTATDDLLGSEKWSAGPGIVAVKITGPWVFGGVANNIWSFAGDGDRAHVNAFFAQYFVNYNFPDFYFTTSPAITANWKAESGEEWTVPFGGGVGKLFKPKGLPPLNCQLAAYYNVEHPDNGAEWQARLQIQMLFPK
jgi:hypothetical protein